MTTFSWRGERLRYFDHPYNYTALNMRRIEIPIVRWYIERALAANPNARILEVGNVLSHYQRIDWPVVDWGEAGCINEDIREYTHSEPIDLLISISTMEHVGGEPATNLRHLRDMLDGDGLAVVTVPLGLNRHLDKRVESGLTGASMTYPMHMIGDNEWAGCTRLEALEAGPRGCTGKWRYGMVVMELRR